MNHLVVFIQYHDGTRRDSCQWAVGNRHPVVLHELRPSHGGQNNHLLQPFSIAKPAHRKREISCDYQYHRIIHVAGFLVEFAGRGGANWSVETRYNIQHLFLPGEIAKGNVFQILVDQRKIRRTIANLGKISFDFDGIACESDHAFSLIMGEIYLTEKPAEY